ncbi:Spy/CpxP family protein refolding chaperone [Winogradskyella sp.]|uniref:Spy/CpxP family protein refolding chaperone n=1 Tax=Winogradskyella sp. TaxID=1883156 RepID=UPI003BA99A60
MKKQLPLYIFYVLLLFLMVVNGFFLFRYLGESNQKDDKGLKEPNNFITKRLDFSEDQLKQFNALEVGHREKMTSISEQIRRSKDALFNNVSKANIDRSVIDSITSVIGDYEKEKDLEVFNHFRAIYNICNESQKAKFDDLIKDALHRRRPPRGHRPPDGKGKDRHGPPPRH